MTGTSGSHPIAVQCVMRVPTEFQGQKYLSLTSFRKSGVPVRTPVWFAEAEGKLYLFTNPKSGKAKRIRNNPRVLIAPCTMRQGYRPGIWRYSPNPYFPKSGRCAQNNEGEIPIDAGPLLVE